MDTKYPWLLLLELQFNDAQDRVARFVRNFEDLWWLSEKYWGTDCVAHWKMNDNAENTTVLESINSLDGTSQRNTNLMSVPGKINTALSFDGTNDYITVADNDLIDMGTSDFAISFQIKSTKTGVQQRLFCKRGGGGYIGYDVYYNSDNKLCSFIGDSGGYLTLTFNDVTGFFDGAWHHIVINFDRDGNATPYLDNVIKTGISIAARQGSLSSEMELVIGAYQINYVDKFTGSLDDIRFYKRLLTTQEIANLYNAGNGTEGGEKPYWQKLAEA